MTNLQILLYGASAASILIWLGLLVMRGGFWRADCTLPAADAAPTAWPPVVAVIPARNEAATIAPVVAAHLQSDYPGRFTLVVVDDQSGDGTAAAARRAGKAGRRELRVVTAPPPKPGWSGKVWAMRAGLREAEVADPGAEYVLLTDADILHRPDTLRRLVMRAETGALALVSLMALLDCRGRWAAILIPAFVFFFQKLYPFSWVNAGNRSTAAAAGGCMLVRRDALTAIGGMEAIRTALIDDCALAAAIKRTPPGRLIWIGLSTSVTSLRDNRAIASIWSMVSRTAFTQLRHSAVLLGLGLLAMALTYLSGPLAVAAGLVSADPVLAVIGACAWALCAVAYRPTVRLYGLASAWAAALPLSAALYMAMMVASALVHWRGGGARWKGRRYPAPAR